MMGCPRFNQFLMIAVVVLAFVSLFEDSISTSSSSSISDGIFTNDSLPGRSLLQAKKSCPVNFEFQDYSIITSQCKGPKYPPSICCPAFKKFACPFVDELNDLTNDCASTMFSYINLHGKYPPGLFASTCREGKDGLECPAEQPSVSANANSSIITSKPSFLHILITAVFLVVVVLRLL